MIIKFNSVTTSRKSADPT